MIVAAINAARGVFARNDGVIRCVAIASCAAFSFAPSSGAGAPSCDIEPLSSDVNVCQEQIDFQWVSAVSPELISSDLVVRTRGRSLLVAVQSDGDAVLPCCSLQEPLVEVEDGIFAAQYQLNHINQAHLMFARLGGNQPPQPVHYFGEDARPALVRADLRGRMETLVLDSRTLGETRRLVLYTSPGFDPAQPYARVVLLDGDSTSSYAQLVEPLIANGHLPELVIVGIPSGQSAILDAPDFGFDVRMADYLPGFSRGGGDRFERHLGFVVDEVLPFARDHLSEAGDPVQSIIAGTSNGAVAALESALARPDVFDSAIVMSRGYRSHEIEVGPTARHVRFRLSAGLYEPNFRRTTLRSFQTLQAGGVDVTYTDYPDGHSPLQWEFAFIDGLTSLLAPPADGVDHNTTH